jgi:hypothetical protein
MQENCSSEANVNILSLIFLSLKHNLSLLWLRYTSQTRKLFGFSETNIFAWLDLFNQTVFIGHLQVLRVKNKARVQLGSRVLACHA